MNFKPFILAQKMSLLSDHRKHHVGAVILRRDRVIGVGFNQRKSHPRSPHTWTIHAELKAILNAREDLTGCTIYVYREHRNGALACARPCIHCQVLLKEVGIVQAHFSTETGYGGMKI
jgi:deoxycytidylate deaminase